MSPTVGDDWSRSNSRGSYEDYRIARSHRFRVNRNFNLFAPDYVCCPRREDRRRRDRT
jgi:hypothetical protein